MPDDVLESVEQETAASVAPTAVTEPLSPIVERLEHIVDKLAGVVTEIPEHTEAEVTPETVEEERDEIPIRKPWTHRMPFGSRNE